MVFDEVYRSFSNINPISDKSATFPSDYDISKMISNDFCKNLLESKFM